MYFPSLIFCLFIVFHNGPFLFGNHDANEAWRQLAGRNIDTSKPVIPNKSDMPSCGLPEEEAFPYRTAYTDLFDPRSEPYERVNSFIEAQSSAVGMVPLVGSGLSGLVNMFKVKSTKPTKEAKCLNEMSQKLQEIGKDIKEVKETLKQMEEHLTNLLNNLNNQLKESTKIILKGMKEVETSIIVTLNRNQYSDKVKEPLDLLNSLYEEMFYPGMTSASIERFVKACEDNYDPRRIAISFKTIFYEDCHPISRHKRSFLNNNQSIQQDNTTLNFNEDNNFILRRFKREDVMTDRCLPAVYMKDNEYKYESAGYFLRVITLRGLKILELASACGNLRFYKEETSPVATYRYFNTTAEYVIPALELLASDYMFGYQAARLEEMKKFFGGHKLNRNFYDGFELAHYCYLKAEDTFLKGYKYIFVGRFNTDFQFSHCKVGPWCNTFVIDNVGNTLLDLIQIPKEKVQRVEEYFGWFQENAYPNIKKMLIESDKFEDFNNPDLRNKYGIFNFSYLSYFAIKICTGGSKVPCILARYVYDGDQKIKVKQEDEIHKDGKKYKIITFAVL